MSYTPFYTYEFQKQLKKYQNLKKHVKRKVELLVYNPYRNCKSEPLHQKLKGLRSARLTKNLRIIFAICEEVKEYESQYVIDLCKKLGSKSVIFITIDVHQKVYGY